jgi:RNA polymerase sporulation-specific sigma factor
MHAFSSSSSTCGENDFERILGAAKRGESDAFAALFRRYRPLVFKVARRYFAPGSGRDDLIQEATIGFYKAIRDYNSSRGSFGSFVELCVHRQVITYIKTATRRKHALLNSAISLDAPLFQNSNDNLGSRLASEQTPERDIEPNHSTFLDLLWNKCSDLERGVLSLYGKGFGYHEMAHELGVHYKSIDNTVWRIKVKAKKLLAEQPPGFDIFG